MKENNLYNNVKSVEDEAQAAQGKGSGSTTNAPFEVIIVVVISNAHHFLKATDDAHRFIKVQVMRTVLVM